VALMEELGERLEGKGWLGVGIGTVILAPIVAPALARGLRPLAKRAIKGYLTLADRARERLAETNEQLQDLVAEARSEYETESTGEEMMTLEPVAANGGAKGGEASSPAEAPATSSAPRKPRARPARKSATKSEED
jgi:hypothetical protein